MRVAIYCRVSTEEQARHGLSLGEQAASLKAYAAINGHVVVGEYVDPGISARKRYTKRPGLLRLLQDAKEKKFDMVLFIKLDRWVRSVRDYYEVQDILDEAGVSWQATQEDYETVTASGRLKVNIMLSVAQDEADRASERIKFVVESKRRKGLRWGTKAPLGLKVEAGELKKDDETWEIAAQMFETFISTRSAVCARDFITEAGHPRAYNVVIRALQNESYKQFLAEETWNVAQNILATRAPRNSRDVVKQSYLFSGLVHCAECGRTMSATKITRGEKVYKYYRCIAPFVAKETCTHRKRVREEALESYLLSNLEILLDYYNFTIVKKADKRKGPSKSRIKAKMDKLKDLYLSDLIEKDTYAFEYAKLREMLNEIEQEEKIVPIDKTAILNGLEMYNELSHSGRKAFWSRILRRIEVDKDGNISVFFQDML